MKHSCALCRHKAYRADQASRVSIHDGAYGPACLEEVRTFAVIVSRIQSSPGSAESAPAQHKKHKQGRDLVYEEYESSSLVVIDQMQPLADSHAIAREMVVAQLRRMSENNESRKVGCFSFFSALIQIGHPSQMCYYPNLNKQVRFNGEKHAYNCHPTWEKTYYDHHGNIIADYKAARKEMQQS